ARRDRVRRRPDRARVVAAGRGPRGKLSAPARCGADAQPHHRHRLPVQRPAQRHADGGAALPGPPVRPRARHPDRSRPVVGPDAVPVPGSGAVAVTGGGVGVGTSGEHRGLLIRQRLLPNRNPFTDAVVVFNDPTLTELTFGYLDDAGAWQDTWDVETQKRLPKAIRVSVGGSLNGRAQTLLPLTVPLRVGTEPQ